MAELPLGTVTFLFTDLEVSTRLWEQEPNAMRGALARHDEILREAVAAGGGQVVKGRGDGVHAAFATADAAVRVAIECQLVLGAEHWGVSEPLRVRMGLHTGVAELRDDDYFGSAVNRAARIMSVGHGGQILLSHATEQLVRDTLPDDCGLRDLGDHQLRGLDRAETIFQVTHAELRLEFPALQSVDAGAGNLPVQLTSFVGRVAEVAELARMIEETRLLSLNGVGGCGKTRLALELADRVAVRYAGGAWLVELAPIADGDLVPAAVATALGERELGGDIVRIVADRIGDLSTLVVLDNCEHLLEPVAEMVAELLGRCAGLVILATSREPIGVPGETTWRVPSLGLPDEANDLERLVGSDAVQLFCERATRVRSDFAVTTDNVETVAQICRRLDGIPLAIELAAARVQALSVEQVAAGLDHRFRLLTGRTRTVLARQRTLQASVDWSYDLLSEPERSVFARMSVFSGGFPLEAAGPVLAGEGVAEVDVIDVVSELVAKSMVVVEASGRYRLLETLREYGGGRLDQSGETPRIRDRHLAWSATLHDPIEHALSGRLGHLRAVDDEIGNLLAAFEWALVSQQPDPALVIADTLLCAFNVTGGVDGSQAFDAGIAALGLKDGNPALRVIVAANLAHTAIDAARYVEAAALRRSMLSEARALDDPGILAFGLYEASRAAMNPDRAVQLAMEAHEIAERIGIPGLMGRSLTVPISSLGRQGDWAGTLELGTTILADPDAGADATGTALFALTSAALHTGRFEAGRDYLEQFQGRDLLELFNSARIRAAHATFWASLDLAQGRDTGAADRIVPILAEARHRNLAAAILASGWVPGAWALAHNDLDAAFGELLAWRREIGGPASSYSYGALVRAYLAKGQIDKACAEFEAVRTLETSYARGVSVAKLILLDGILTFSGGDAPAAQKLLVQALVAQRDGGWTPDLTHTLEALAPIASAGGSHATCARLAGAAQAFRDDMGYVLRWPYEQQLLDTALAGARRALGRDFEAAYDDGRALDVEAAVSLATQDLR